MNNDFCIAEHVKTKDSVQLMGHEHLSTETLWCLNSQKSWCFIP